MIIIQQYHDLEWRSAVLVARYQCLTAAILTAALEGLLQTMNR